jgi:hypothetical protein
MAMTYMNGAAADHTTADSPPAAAPKRGRKKTAPPVPIAAPSSFKPPVTWFGLTHNQIVGWVAGIVGALIAAGWVTLPAKQSEVEELVREMRGGFARINDQFTIMTGKFQSIETKMENIRADIVRVQTVQEVQASTSSPPTAPNKPMRRAAKPTETKATLFGLPLN